jgi:hypothetical protein
MKMVKSLLLGSAAGLVAVTAGQAADLPVKAKPVEYVKVCSLYGAGFYYMPGTDMCIKIGGWMRFQVTDGQDNGSTTWGPYAGNPNIRTTSNLQFLERGYITADAREQTAYGTARAYIDVGINDAAVLGQGLGTGTFSSNRGFLQWAGITAGLTQSFYDFYSAPAVAYNAAQLPIEDTGSGGTSVIGYTAQLGNGLTATLAAETRRVNQIIGVNGGAAGAGAVIAGSVAAGGGVVGGGYGGNEAPDIVANLRLDQTWGSAQVMGALHEDNASYYDPAVVSGNGAGHPSDQWGFVVGAGLRLNFPMIAQGDYFQGEVNYTQGALGYLHQAQGAAEYEAEQSNTGAFGQISDCVYGSTSVTAAIPATGGTSCNLTTAWSVNASYEHYWTPSVHESLYGAYWAVNYNSQANGILCVGEGAGAITGVGVFTPAAGCNNNWSSWGIGSRLQWDVTKSFYLGVEGLYTHLNSASLPGGVLTAAVANGAPSPAAGTVTIGGAAENAWQVSFRMHKDFLP